MSQPPQDGQDPQVGQPSPGQGGTAPQGGGNPPQRPGPQGPYPPQGFPQPGYPPRQGYPPQGYPQQPGHPGQQPYAGVPGPQPYAPYAPGPYAPGQYAPGQYGPGQAGPPGQEPKKKRTGLFVLIGVGALALILVVVAFAVNLGGSHEGAGGGTTGGGGGGGSSAPAAATASDAVSGFLQAVAKGDPATAVSYAASPGLDTTLMTPEVLAASAKLAPMTDIAVTPVTDPDATSVPVTYTLGKTPVSTSFEVVKTSDDAWKLAAISTDLDVSVVKEDGIPMLVNGVALKKATVALLPGVYRFTSGQPNYDYGKQNDLLVESPADSPDITQLQPGLSSKGRAAALSALKKSWSKCLDSDDAKPSGCPNRWNNDAYKFKNGTVSWSRKGSDPVKKPLTNVYSTYVIYSVKVDLELKGTCSADGRTGSCKGSLTGGTALARADVSGSKVKISW